MLLPVKMFAFSVYLIKVQASSITMLALLF